MYGDAAPRSAARQSALSDVAGLQGSATHRLYTGIEEETLLRCVDGAGVPDRSLSSIKRTLGLLSAFKQTGKVNGRHASRRAEHS
jgi:hypothetical protein